MAEQLFNGVTEHYRIPVLAAGGFNRVTAIHALGREIAEGWLAEGRPTLVPHLGVDPDGEAIFTAYAEDVIAFVRHYAPDVEIEFRRVAVTPEQIRGYDLPTQPVKETASRRARSPASTTIPRRRRSWRRCRPT